MIRRPERFEPDRGPEIRRAIEEGFGGSEDLMLADVVFERDPDNPGGEAGIVLQSAWRIKGRSYGIEAEYVDLAFVEVLLGSGELGGYLGDLKRKTLEKFSERERAEDPDPEETAMRDLEELRNPSKRNRLGSRIVRDEGLYKRRMKARQENEGDSVMTLQDYLRLRGWVRFFDVEVREEWRRRSREDSLYQFMGDQGVRYLDPLTNMVCDPRGAEAGQLIKDMISVGGVKAYKEILDEHRIQ